MSRNIIIKHINKCDLDASPSHNEFMNDIVLCHDSSIAGLSGVSFFSSHAFINIMTDENGWYGGMATSTF